MLSRLNKTYLSALVFFIAVLSLVGASCTRTTVPATSSISSWKFAVVSDTQGNKKASKGDSCINDAVVHAIAGDLVREKPDLVLVSGDLVNGWIKNGGTSYTRQYQNWKKAMAPVYDSGIRVYPIRGNHDSGPERLVLPPLPARLEPPPGALDALKAAFLSTFNEPYIPQNGPHDEQIDGQIDGQGDKQVEGEADERGLTYSFSHKNAFFVGLDQYSSCQHQVNQAWLDRQLQGNTLPHLFIYGHEPAFEMHHKDNLSCFPALRDQFWDSIGNAGAIIYFCGHDHFYNRALIPDSAGHPLRQIIVSPGGGRMRTWSGTYREADRMTREYHNEKFHGYMLASVENSCVTVRWKALTNPKDAKSFQVLDTFSYCVQVSPAN